MKVAGSTPPVLLGKMVLAVLPVVHVAGIPAYVTDGIKIASATIIVSIFFILFYAVPMQIVLGVNVTKVTVVVPVHIAVAEASCVVFG